MQILELGVRDFITLALKSGGLCAEFSPRARAAAGAAAHLGATARRPEGYQREVPIMHIFEWHGFRLVVRGRIDGLIREKSGTLIEEIKSTFHPLQALDADGNPYHLAQLRLYHHFACCRFAGERIIPVLTYVHPLTLEERSFTMPWSPEESRAFFEDLAVKLLQQELERRRWRGLRNKSIRQLTFPHPSMRPGQGELITAVERAAANHHDLLIEAATGIGKTLGVLYPALRQLAGRHGFSRIFYLTAKSAGVDVVRNTIATLRAQGLRLRVLYLQAKERSCPLAGDARPECDAAFCPYAEEFYTKAEQVIPRVLDAEEMTPELIATVADDEILCPFELSLELALSADLIVCDYNYAFDPSACLRRFFSPGMPGDNLFLIDEAHNLVARGREMYSAVLQSEALVAVRDDFSHPGDMLYTCLDTVLAQFTSWRDSLEFEGATAMRLPAVPDDMRTGIDGALDLTGELLLTLPRGERRNILLDFYFALAQFSRIAAEISPEYAVYLTGTRRSTCLHLSCLHPGPLLRRYLQASVAAVFFSATLSPYRYFRELLGAREQSAHLALPSPFPREHRLYLHVPDVSTKYAAREATKPSVAQVIRHAVHAKPGNYLAFFPSYAYLGAVWAEIMVARPSDLQVYAQQPGMNREQQTAFLRKVCAGDGERANLGLAVMGGLFGEAIDLPGEQLIGAIIVGPGLPAISPEQELIGEYFNETHADEGFYYAYVVPGLIRVIQAAGRVFRTPHDRGVVLLMDDRFLEEPYRDLLPADWSAQDPDFSTPDYQSVLRAFWDG